MKNSKKIMGSIIVVIMIIILVSISSRNSPFEAVKEMRDGVLDYGLISKQESNDHVLLYTFGKVNNAKDNMYFVDMAKNTFFGYEWIGGGGHINRDIGDKGKEFMISIQLLNENQKITPSMFGVVLDQNVKDIIITIPDEPLHKATQYDGINQKEKFYVVHLASDISNIPYLRITIIFNDDSELIFLPSNEELEWLQQGQQLYIDKDSANAAN